MATILSTRLTDDHDSPGVVAWSFRILMLKSQAAHWVHMHEVNPLWQLSFGGHRVSTHTMLQVHDDMVPELPG